MPDSIKSKPDNEREMEDIVSSMYTERKFAVPAGTEDSPSPQGLSKRTLRFPNHLA